VDNADWTYDEGCGCRITFSAESGYRTSRLLPGSHCLKHTGRDATEVRDALIARAKYTLVMRFKKLTP
jgi:hypothetical protein